jgi:hypothetical protein
MQPRQVTEQVVHQRVLAVADDRNGDGGRIQRRS